MTEEPTRFLPELRTLADKGRLRIRRRRRREMLRAFAVGLLVAGSVWFGAFVSRAAS